MENPTARENGPQLSIAIACNGRQEPLQRCFRSLERATGGAGVEVVVAQAGMRPIETTLPAVRVLGAPAGSSIARLRSIALAAARARRCAVLSEDYTVAAGWIDAALRAGEGVTAGVVEPPPEAGWTARAIYLWEYSHAAPPQSSGSLGEAEARLVPAGCVVYSQGAADPDEIAAAASELDYHAAMFRRGVPFRRDAELLAYYHPPELGVYLRDRYRWSQELASARAKSRGPGGRLAQALSRLLLPALLLFRLTANVAAKPRWAPLVVSALPLYLAFACIQTLGEITGFLERGDG